ncbi:MAG: hypothetical protein DHS20C14_09180 [Phycisphaeraceae bacterium]|nr:MAG: hypothetical protein DHS20C14_09180 [Phycisphaeraceae bacterium]
MFSGRGGQALTLALTTLHVGLLGVGVLLLMRLAVDAVASPIEVLYQLVGVLCGLALTGPGMATVIASVTDRRQRVALRRMNQQLETEIRQRVTESLATRNALIFGLAKLADYRDNDTGTHLERIGEYVVLLANELRTEHDEIDDRWIERLKLASSLHDIGKVGIPDAVLLKPGKLDADERLLMEQHPLMGADTLLAIRRQLGHDPFLDMGVEVTLQHHEKWDGSGYPFGLSGDMIALSARIVALADFYDALTSVRVYKDAMPHRDTVELVRSLRGTHFDPEIVDVFLTNAGRFDDIRRTLQPRSGDRAVPKIVELAQKYLRRTHHSEDPATGREPAVPVRAA